MRRPTHPPITTFSNRGNSLLGLLCLVFIVLFVGSVIAPTVADGQTDTDKTDRWAKHPALQPFEVSGKELPSTLFFVRTRGELPQVEGVAVHGVNGGVFLVSGERAVVQGLARFGCAVVPVPDSLPDPFPPQREWTWIDTPDPDIQAMVDQVTWTGVLDKIQWLVDFGTRFSLAPNHSDVARSIGDKFDAYGLQTALHSFDYYGNTMWNVEATQTGTLYPNSYVIICGHFDSMSEDPMATAPGADDNATGAAAVLTAAEILSKYEFEYSIRYICFGGEELGLVGSYYYATEAWLNNLDIVGLLNFDMLGYWEPGVEKDLEIETNQASQWLAEAITNAADLYTDAPYEVHVYDWAWWGDHFWFWMRGYPAVNHEEAWDWYDPDFNPHYHSSTDFPDYLDPDFTVGNIKVGVAALATLANAEPPVPVSFDMRPGSCPNPFNPKSHGVIPALLLGSAAFDVRDLNFGSLRLADWVSPTKVRIADMGSVNHDNGHPCADMSPDGYPDLWLKFSTDDIVTVMETATKGDAARFHIRGRLFDGTVIEGEDIVGIVGYGGGTLGSRRSFDTPFAKTGMPESDPVLPKVFALHQNVPNPFNPTTSIRFDVPAGGGIVSLRIYDVTGRLVRTLVDGVQTPGEKAVMWDGRNARGNTVAAGAYLYRLTGPGFEQTRKMILIK